jgi:hypothetical protein
VTEEGLCQSMECCEYLLNLHCERRQLHQEEKLLSKAVRIEILLHQETIHYKTFVGADTNHRIIIPHIKHYERWHLL